MTKSIGQIYDEAVAAGYAAGEASRPTPMVVQQRASVLDDSSPVTKEWHVPEGMCGFAWVIVPGNTPMGRYMKTKGHRKGYPSGISYYVSAHGQSYERKSAHARAFSKVLTAHGIKNYYESRLD